jgi:ribonuclease G
LTQELRKVSKRIIVNSENGETRAAIVEDGMLADLFIERSLHPRYAGNIYKGVVENVLPGMQAAFVNVGLERNVFLYVDDALAARGGHDMKAAESGDDDSPPPSKKERSIKDILKTGQEIIVQVTKEPIGTKGARVVTDITLPGRYVVLMPTVDYVGVSRRINADGERDRLRKIAQSAKPRKMGVIVRTVAEGRSEEEISNDIQFLVKLWRRIQARARRAKAPSMLHQDYDLAFRLVRDHFSDDVDEMILDDPDEFKKVTDLMKMLPEQLAERVQLYTGTEPLFDVYGLEEEIARALRRKVWLACGGYLIIDHTEALTVIDVNTGKFTGTTCLADTVFKTNIEAAVEIARQLRLRNIGGIIVIDFIDMEEESHQKQVIAALEKAMEGDKTKASVLGFTQLGLVEMTRKKVQQGLQDSMMKVCPICEGRGRTLSEETLALRAMRAIKKEALTNEHEAMLLLLHPSVAAMLIGSGGANLAALEKETGKSIYVKGSLDQAPEDIAIAALGTKEEVERMALPVAVGDDLSLLIEEAHMTNSRDGIARVEGYVIDVEGAGGLVGRRVRAQISRVFKTYAKAKLVLTTGKTAAARAGAGAGAGEAVGADIEPDETGGTPVVVAERTPPQPIKRLDVVSLSPVAPPPPARPRPAAAVQPPIEAEMLLPGGRIREPLDNYDVATAIGEVEAEGGDAVDEKKTTGKSKSSRSRSRNGRRRRRSGSDSSSGATGEAEGQSDQADAAHPEGQPEAAAVTGDAGGVATFGADAQEAASTPEATSAAVAGAEGAPHDGAVAPETAADSPGSPVAAATTKKSRSRRSRGGRGRSRNASKAPVPDETAATQDPGLAGAVGIEANVAPATVDAAGAVSPTPADSDTADGGSAQEADSESAGVAAEADTQAKKPGSRRGRGRRGGRRTRAKKAGGDGAQNGAAGEEQGHAHSESTEPQTETIVDMDAADAPSPAPAAARSRSAKRRSRRKAAKRARAAAEATNGVGAPGSAGEGEATGKAEVDGDQGVD